MSSQHIRPALLYLACYTLWLGLVALGGWIIVVGRSALVGMAFAYRFNPWAVQAIDNFGVVTMGLVWLVFILWLEHYLRQGVEKQRLWSRAAWVLTFEAALLGFCYIVPSFFSE